MSSIRYAFGHSQLGPLLVAVDQDSTDEGVCALFLGADTATSLSDLQSRDPQRTVVESNDLQDWLTRAVACVENPRRNLDLRVILHGTPFQQRVWAELQKIPAGVRRTYTEIAQQIGSPRSCRAVANACGQNPVAVAVPCHRVVRRDGTLGGYYWGIEIKQTLLALESIPLY